MTALGDSMLIYRCFIIHDRSWRVIAPSLVFVAAGIGLVAATIYFEVTLPPGEQLSSPFKQIQIAAWSMTVAINILTTGELSFKLLFRL
jgi:hypothetical protein